MHTRGQWVVGEESGNDGESFIIVGGPCDRRRYIAYVGDVLIGDEGAITQECVDNARLIAAAPDLLAALEEIVETLLGITPSEALMMQLSQYSVLGNALEAIDRAHNGPVCETYRDIVPNPEDD